MSARSSHTVSLVHSNGLHLQLCGSRPLRARFKLRRTEGRDLAKRFNAQCIETSAKQRVNVDEAFIAVVRAIRRFQKVSRGYQSSASASAWLCGMPWEIGRCPGRSADAEVIQEHYGQEAKGPTVMCHFGVHRLERYCRMLCIMDGGTDASR
jgi:hypothetical protein